MGLTVVATVATVAAGVAGWLLAQAASDNSPLLEFGAAVGVAGVAASVIRVLYKRLTDTHERELQARDQVIERERNRCDRLEDELRKQQAVIQDRVLTALFDSTRAVQEAMAVVKERR